MYEKVQFFILWMVISVESARILGVFPFPAISHQVVFRPLMQELAKRGHEVVVITTDPAFPKGSSPHNLTEIDVHDVAYRIWKKFLETTVADDEYTQVKTFLDMITIIFEAEIKSTNVQKLLKDKNQNFDLIFVESCITPALSLGYFFDVPIIEFSSLGGIFRTFDGTGTPTNSLVYPVPLRRKIFNLTIWEKISELYLDYANDKVIKDHEKIENKMIRSIFGPNVPDLNHLKKNVQLVFLNIHPVWDFNRPVPPNIIYLGGIHQIPAKELPQELKTFLDSSNNGVIYMSFGTNVKPSMLPPEKIKFFTKIFSELQYDILWKWDKESLPDQPKNVKISKWFPQSDLLKHPKVKLFITQGGLQSIDEALTGGVPLIVVPLFADQFFNAEHCVKLNIGIQLDIETLTEKELKNSLYAIMTDNMYHENVVKVRNIFRDQPQSPLERAVWWTEYVLRHGGASHLKCAAAHMTWKEYYAFDLILLVMTSLVAFIVTIFVIRHVISKFKVLKLKMKMS